jgi:hypothetical protein
MTKRIAELNAPPPPVVVAQQPSNPAAPQPRSFDSELRAAYRAFALGDLAQAEQVLNRVLRQTSVAEAYLLRGCARYTRAMLSRTPDAVLGEARSDFQAALAQNRALKLDPSAFSPKLVTFFEDVRRNGR